MIDLTTKKINELSPEELAGITQSVRFNGGNKPIVTERLFELVNVKELILFNVVNIPDNFHLLPNLRSLVFEHNKYLRSLPVSIGKLRLKYFTLFFCPELNNIPDEVWNMTVDHIGLDALPWKTLPPALLRNSNVKTLHIALSFLTHIPKEIENMTNLEKLEINFGHQFTFVHENVGKLYNLRKFCLKGSRQPISRLPESLGNLYNLQRLTIIHIALDEIPPFIFRLTNLRSLALSENKITEIPRDILKLTNLQRLYMYCNRLTNIPYFLSEMDLRNIDVHTNNKNLRIPFKDEPRFRSKNYFDDFD